MGEETFTETVERYRALFQQKPEWTPDEAAQAAFAEGKSVVEVMGILQKVFGVSLREAKGAALYIPYGPKYKVRSTYQEAACGRDERLSW